MLEYVNINIYIYIYYTHILYSIYNTKCVYDIHIYIYFKKHDQHKPLITVPFSVSI